MIVTNKPGASSIIANNFMAKAEPDGLTIFWGVGGQPTNQLTRADETEYEFDKFVRIGTFENRPAAWYISGDAPTTGSRTPSAAPRSSPTARPPSAPPSN